MAQSVIPQSLLVDYIFFVVKFNVNMPFEAGLKDVIPALKRETGDLKWIHFGTMLNHARPHRCCESGWKHD
jgi:hypothetical protein